MIEANEQKTSTMDIAVSVKDLYIPPDALRVFLEAFEGPLDLLLYLIRKQDLDIRNIPIAEITKQYMEYINVMEQLKLELAAEYLVMAAMLAEIKSRMLLPRLKETAEGEEEDPRAELIRRLEEYECFKKAATDINKLPRVYREVFPVGIANVMPQAEKKLPEVLLKDLALALNKVLKRAKLTERHQIQAETLSVRERMTCILDKLAGTSFAQFHVLFDYEEGRVGIVVTFIAILELLKQSVIEVVQVESSGGLFIKSANVSENHEH